MEVGCKVTFPVDFSVVGTRLYDVGSNIFTDSEESSETGAVDNKTNPTLEMTVFVTNVVFNSILCLALINQSEPAQPDLTEVSPDSIAHLLQQLRITDHLSSSMFYGSPIINFQIGERSFHAVIGNEDAGTDEARIVVHEGLSDEADIQFNTNEACILGALSSDDPVQFLRNSGQIQMIKVTNSDAELVAKGYLGLRDQLQAGA